MYSLEKKLTEREKAWIREYYKAEGNATEATRRVYGGTPGSCRVKGHKKLMKFEPILSEIEEREFDKMEYQEISGIEFYLGCLERDFERGEEFGKMMKGFARRGLSKLLKGRK